MRNRVIVTFSIKKETQKKLSILEGMTDLTKGRIVDRAVEAMMQQLSPSVSMETAPAIEDIPA